VSDNRGLAGQLRHGLSRPAQAFYNKLNCEGRSDRTRGYSLSELDHSIDARQVFTCCLIKPNEPPMVAEALTLVGLNFPQSKEGARRVRVWAYRRYGVWASARDARAKTLVGTAGLSDLRNPRDISETPWAGSSQVHYAHTPSRRYAHTCLLAP